MKLKAPLHLVACGAVADFRYLEAQTSWYLEPEGPLDIEVSCKRDRYGGIQTNVRVWDRTNPDESFIEQLIFTEKKENEAWQH